MTPPGTRPGSFAGSPHGRADRSDEPDLITEFRRCLSTGEPLDLLAEVSSLVAAIDPRRKSPFDRAGREEHQGPSLDELTHSFADIDLPETSALLAAVAELAPDDLVRARARRALRSRTDRLPEWLEHLNESEVYRAVAMVHVLGDGDNIMLAVRLADRQELSVVLYVDHNLGTVVKDAFVVPGPITELMELMRTKLADPDVEWPEVALSDARAKIVEAMQHGDMTYPRFETDTWPASQPIVEWIVRLLPDGGTGYVRPEWSDQSPKAVDEAVLRFHRRRTSRRSRSSPALRVAVVVRNRLWPRRSAALESGSGRDPSHGLDSSQNHGRRRASREGSGASAFFHPLLPCRAWNSERAHGRDDRSRGSMGTGVPERDPITEAARTRGDCWQRWE